MYNDIKQKLNDLGFFPEKLELDEQWHRFKRDQNESKDSCTYIGTQLHGRKSGLTFMICTVRDWKTGEQHTVRSDHDYSADDNESIKKFIRQSQDKLKLEIERKQNDALVKATKTWSEASETIDHVYVTKKKIKPYGARQKDDQLIVPMRNAEGQITSIQTIFKSGRKMYAKDGRVAGSFLLIKGIDVNASDYSVYVTEGWATACTIHEATMRDVYVAFSANNLEAVAIIAAKQNPTATIIIAGDDDYKTDGNPGRTYGDKAAKAIGALAIYPDFADRSHNQTDFNDLAYFEGIGAVKEQLKLKAGVAQRFEALGFDNTGLYFFRNDEKSIIKLTSTTEDRMLHLAPKAFWEARFKGKKAPIDWLSAKDAMIQMAREKGDYNPDLVRGNGVWLDDGRVVVSTPGGVIINGEYVDEFQSRFVYPRFGPKVRRKPIPRSATIQDCAIIAEAATFFNWRHKCSGMKLAGWLAIARMAGALKVRPHVWLTGSKITGKTTVFNNFVMPVLGADENYFPANGSSTEAGIRQMLGHHALPLLFDEFETTNKRTGDKVESILELFRQSYSPTRCKIVRGTPGGEAMSFNPLFIGMVLSITVNFTNDADESRFTVLELGPTDGNKTEWEKLSDRLDRTLCGDFADRFFMRSVGMFHTIESSYKVAKKFLSNLGIKDNRWCEINAMLLAGYYSLISDDVITDEKVDQIANQFDIAADDEDEGQSDSEACLTHLLSRMFWIDGQTMSIGRVMEMEREALDTWTRKFKSYGIIIDDGHVWVSNSGAELRKHFSGTRWENNAWGKALKRLDGAVVTKVKRWSGNVTKGVRIKIE